MLLNQNITENMHMKNNHSKLYVWNKIKPINILQFLLESPIAFFLPILLVLLLSYFQFPLTFVPLLPFQFLCP